jgi:hypothetical protein
VLFDKGQLPEPCHHSNVCYGIADTALVLSPIQQTILLDKYRNSNRVPSSRLGPRPPPPKSTTLPSLCSRGGACATAIGSRAGGNYRLALIAVQCTAYSNQQLFSFERLC